MASQDLSTTGLEGCQPASGDDAFYDWFLFFYSCFEFDNLSILIITRLA